MAARIVVLWAVVALSACTGNSLGLTGAGSMRVEVEVYKGPLSNDVPIQIGELRTVVEETARTLMVWYDGAKKIGPSCTEFDCIALKEATDATQEVLGRICRISQYVTSPDILDTDADQKCPNDMTIISTSLREVSNKNISLSIRDLARNQETIARRLGQLAGDMKAKGFRIAYSLVSYVPNSEMIRIALANFNLIMFEYSNQIQARVAVLDKQFTAMNRYKNDEEYQGRRKQLPVGDYLRDASPTDVIHLFEWLDAGDAGFGTPGQLSLEERVRMAERLFADYYWEKINEVYASGQGKVSMAFIKNDIGNWDLKSFSNDPAELLAAYSKAANAAISAAVGLATGSKGLSAGEEMLDLGNRLATGETSAQPNLGVLDARALHGRTLAKLATRRAAFVERQKKLETDKTAAAEAATAAEAKKKPAADAVTDAEVKRTTAEELLATCRTAHPQDAEMACKGQDKDRQTASTNLENLKTAQMAADAEANRTKLAAAEAEAALTALPKEAQKDIRDVLDDHMALIAMLQEAVAGSVQPEATATGAMPAIPPQAAAAPALTSLTTASLVAVPPTSTSVPVAPTLPAPPALGPTPTPPALGAAPAPAAPAPASQ